MSRALRYTLIILLLLLHFGIRSYNSDLQPAYVDEGFHTVRATQVWDFEQNPGRFAHGKVLVYFWIGLFEADNTPTTLLPVARLSIAMMSVLTAALVYQVGRQFGGDLAGLLALLLYALTPLAVFYERMAMADPLAAMLMTLTVWRSLILVRRPSLRQGVIVGVCVGLMTLAKLTVALLVLLPGFITLVLYPWRRESVLKQVRGWMQRYLPALIVSGVVVVLLWSPMLIPAYFAHQAGDPFVIVNDNNIARGSADDDPANPLAYGQRLIPVLGDFVSEPALFAIGGFWLVGLLLAIARRDAALTRTLLILAGWTVLLCLLSFLVARLVTARYFMPLVVPGVLIVAIVSGAMLRMLPAKAVVAGSLMILMGTWMVTVALPFIVTDLHDPLALDFETVNYTEYQAGYLMADETIRATAQTLNDLPLKPVYVTWNLCHMLYFYTDYPLTCLPISTPSSSLRVALLSHQGESVYHLMTDYQPYWHKIDGVMIEEHAVLERQRIKRPVYVLEMWLPSD